MVAFSKIIGLEEKFTGPELFQPKAHPAYASSKLCEFFCRKDSNVKVFFFVMMLDSFCQDENLQFGLPG